MYKSEKKLKELEILLNKDNKTIITEAIDLLRNDQAFEGVVGLLTSVYDNSPDHEIRKSVELFMNDIKDLSVRPEVINEIKKPWKPDTISMLVSSCWQSGLDYSEYSQVFVNTFLSGDYVTAIECLTVISESAHNISKVEKEIMITTIKDNPFMNSDEKSVLTLELLTVLENPGY
jgi:hypothetical protein